jgi:hypothetical protein
MSVCCRHRRSMLAWVRFPFSQGTGTFARFEALTDHFCVHFGHQLPGPNVKTETQRPLNALY